MFKAPLEDQQFVLRHLAELPALAQLPLWSEAQADLVDAVLQENARFVEGVIAPLTRVGDEHGASLENGKVQSAPGYREAFAEYGAGGWQGLQHPAEFGGQGLPKVAGTPCMENLNAADLSFALCPLLTDGAIEALLTAGSDEQKALYVPRLVDGSWTGTMNLTEPQAGSDLSQVRTRAVPQSDGTYRIFGQKIYITWGEHDVAENIIHLVLARTPDAPEGVKGISLFIVPKVLTDAQGKLGARNDVWCHSIEHKLGIKASPTAVLIYGDGRGEVGEGAIGYLVGQENRGLEYMFIMMNAARFAVGVQGISISERAYQKAVAYARDRVQSRAVEGSTGPVAIVQHPDVKRMLLTMRALTEGARALAYVAAAHHDRALGDPSQEARVEHQAIYEYLVPIVKGFCTEMSLETSSLGVQVHGGMGFIEETGAAQFYRDARILTIYEGTTAIQANDLVGRKTARDQGRVAQWLAGQVRQTLAQARSVGLLQHAEGLEHALRHYEAVVQQVVQDARAKPRETYAGSVPYLMLSGYLLAGWQMVRAAMVAQQALGTPEDSAFLQAKRATSLFFVHHLLPRTAALAQAVLQGAEAVVDFPEAAF